MQKQYILVDVDTQVDFMLPEGALYVEAPSRVHAYIKELTRLDLPRIGSVDSHSYDAWEFEGNGGPFPPHCVKGTAGWLKPEWALPEKTRFIPMGKELVVGEAKEGDGNRSYGIEEAQKEVREGVSLYFEKEVYSLFLNPMAAPIVDALAEGYRKEGKEPVFVVYGYCTGGFCVDAATEGLVKQGHKVVLLLDSTAPLEAKGGVEATTLPMTNELGIEVLETNKFLESL